MKEPYFFVNRISVACIALKYLNQILGLITKMVIKLLRVHSECLGTRS